MVAAVAVLIMALVLSAESAPEKVRMARGSRGGEEDDTVVVEAGNEIGEPYEPACPPGEVFMTCGSACPKNCFNIRAPIACPNVCAVGCFCPEGLVRDYSGRCIDENHC